MQKVTVDEMRAVSAGDLVKKYSEDCPYCDWKYVMNYFGPISQAFVTWWCEDKARKHLYEKHYNSYLD